MRTKRNPISPGAAEEAGTRRFFRHERLKKGDEISRVFKKGRSVTCPGARLFYLDNGLGHNRICFTFARKYGNAVQRNRARRLGREAWRLLSGSLKPGRDLVLLVYPDKSSGRRPVLADRLWQLKNLVTKAGLL